MFSKSSRGFCNWPKAFKKSRRFLQYGVKADQLEKYDRDIVGIIVDIDNDKQYMNDDDSKIVVVVNSVLQI